MQTPVKQDHRLRSYGLQLLLLLLTALAGSALYWRTGTATSGAQAVPKASPPPRTSQMSVTTISFKHTIEPIFTANCASCHLAGQISGGLQLDTYADQVHGGSIVPGPIFIAGDHAHSVLWQIIQPGGNWPGGNRMPLSGPPYLSVAQIQTIANWIDQGSKNN